MINLNDVVKKAYSDGYLHGMLDGGLAGAITCDKLLKEAAGTPAIKEVRFNEPATIIFWADGTKTVVQAQCGEPFDKEKGLAMAIIKKMNGNEGSYYDVFHKYCPEEAERTK